MTRWILILCTLTICGSDWLYGQVAYDCANAVPICNNTPVNAGTEGYGVDDFNGDLTSGCLEQTITGVIESNSAWYRFRTGATGQLGFNIGFNTSEDWDFALYLASDCGDLGEPVRCNFFDNQDEMAFMGVGQDPSGDPGSVLYEDWLQVTPGEDYYLLINNFTNTNSGFSIQFSGEIFVTNPHDALDCSIVSNLLGPPVAACSNENVILNAMTSNAQNYTWYRDMGAGFQLLPTESGPTMQALISGIYRVEVQTLTLNVIISDVQVGFTPAPVTHEVSDEVVCDGAGIFDLSDKTTEALGSQSTSDVLVSFHSSLSQAAGGLNPLPGAYPLSMGSATIYIRTASLQNEACFDVSEQFELSVLETPILNIPSEVFICEQEVGVLIGEFAPDPAFSYVWDSGEQVPSIYIISPGSYTLTATSTGPGGLTCSAATTITVVFSKTPEISDIIIEDVRDNNTVEVIAHSPSALEYQLDQGPFQSTGIFREVAPGNHRVTVNDPGGCGSTSEQILVIGFPKYFTPNGDGTNDRWNIIGIPGLSHPVVHLYDRFGKLIKELQPDSDGWDGTFNGRLLPSSDYWFKLSYVDERGTRVEAKYLDSHFSLKR